MSTDGQRIKWRRKIAENFNRLSRVHEHYRRQTKRRQTDGRSHFFSRVHFRTFFRITRDFYAIEFTYFLCLQLVYPV